MQLYSPKSIANYFIDLAKVSGDKLTPMKLQKLVYYAMGWFAGYTGKPLVDEAVEAWQYGPVFSSLYHEFKQFGSGPIDGKATEYDVTESAVVEAPTRQILRFENFLIMSGPATASTRASRCWK